MSRVGRVERPRGLIVAWVCACCAQRRRPAVALTKPSRPTSRVLFGRNFRLDLDGFHFDELRRLVDAFIVGLASPASLGKSTIGVTPKPPLLGKAGVKAIVVAKFRKPNCATPVIPAAAPTRRCDWPVPSCDPIRARVRSRSTSRWKTRSAAPPPTSSPPSSTTGCCPVRPEWMFTRCTCRRPPVGGRVSAVFRRPA